MNIFIWLYLTLNWGEIEMKDLLFLSDTIMMTSMEENILAEDHFSLKMVM